MNKKRICFFTPVSLNSIGGGERVLCVLANELSKEHEVHIVSYDSEGSFYFISDNIRLHKLGMKKSRNYFLRKFQPLFYLKNFRHYIKQQQFDEVIALSEIGCLFVSLALCFFKIKKLAWLHNSYFEPQPFIIRISRKFVLSFFYKTIVLNKTDERIYREQKGLKNIVRIPNPLTIESERKSELKEKRIISVGRLNRQKGFNYLIEACLPVLEKNAEWKLDIFGQDDGIQAALQHQIEQTLCSDRITIHPPTSEIMSEYLNSSIFAFTSLFESFGLVLLEAAEAGLPLIAFDSPSGIADIVTDGYNGFLVEKINIQDFTAKLQLLVNKPELREQYAKGSIATARNFSIEKIIKLWNEIL